MKPLRMRLVLALALCSSTALAFLGQPSRSSCGTSALRSLRDSANAAHNHQTDNMNDDDDDDWTWRDAATRWILRRVLDSFKESDLVNQKHKDHMASKSVVHLFQSTPLAKVEDSLKLQFVSSQAGKILEQFMKEEQLYLQDWKVEKVVEAAGDYNAMDIRRLMANHHLSAVDDDGLPTIVMYSFVDCPWCVAARTLLENHYKEMTTVKIIELEALEETGKAIRAELALQTGRTSLPSVWIRGSPIGGYSDGIPCGPGLLHLHETSELSTMLQVE